MDKRREFRNGELVDVYYDENGEDELIHWVRIPRNSGRYPRTKTDITYDSGHKNGHEVARAPEITR